ncbi:hypothetical protein D3C86_2028130 [compost metagenome]
MFDDQVTTGRKRNFFSEHRFDLLIDSESFKNVEFSVVQFQDLFTARSNSVDVFSQFSHQLFIAHVNIREISIQQVTKNR